jgi:hypothetical protein
MTNLQQKIRCNGCGKVCETVYLLERLCEFRNVEEYIFNKIDDRSKKEFVVEDESRHKENFRKYGSIKDCTNYNCLAPYVLRAFIEEEHLSDDVFEQIKEMNDHKYYMGQKFNREFSWNEVVEDWVKNGYAFKFRKEYQEKVAKNPQKSFGY